MFFLKCAKLICDLAKVEPWEIKAVKFGYSVAYEAATTYNLAAQMVPNNMGLAVVRVQCYLTDIDNTVNGFDIYRVIPEGVSWWQLARTAGGSSITNFTATPAPGHLPLDCDELLLFPPEWIVNLQFTATNAPPATGTWRIRTTCFGFFVPPKVYEALGGTQDWINAQQ